MNDKYKLYLNDLGYLLKTIALEAKRNEKQSVKEEEKTYNAGYLMAMHRVISLMQQQCLGFHIDLDEINLKDINPEEDLT